LLPCTTLQVGNRPRASTTQTTHPGHALVQWSSSGDHLSSATSLWLHLLNFSAKVVPDELWMKICTLWATQKRIDWWNSLSVEEQEFTEWPMDDEEMAEDLVYSKR